MILWPYVRLPEESNQLHTEIILHIVSWFQFHRTCFQRAEASVNFRNNNNASVCISKICKYNIIITILIRETELCRTQTQLSSLYCHLNIHIYDPFITLPQQHFGNGITLNQYILNNNNTNYYNNTSKVERHAVCSITCNGLFLLMELSRYHRFHLVSWMQTRSRYRNGRHVHREQFSADSEHLH